MGSEVDGKLLALITAICFGLNPVVLKLGFSRRGTSEVALVVGLAVTVPIYLLVAPLLGGFEFGRVTVPALIGFILGGLFGTGIGRRWMYIAIERIGASPATAIKNSAPVITTFLAVLFLAEEVTLLQWAAIASIVVGITFVTWKQGAGLRQLRDVGVLAAVGSALSYGVRPLFLKFGLDEVDVPLTAALIGAVAALVYVSLFTRIDRMRDGLRGRSAPYFIGAGVLQAFGFLALTFGLSTEDVSIVYPVTSTAPLFTLAFTALLLRGVETLTWRIVLGAAAVVGGVVWL
jgi:drug/metabolite transporter, DME family